MKEPNTPGHGELAVAFTQHVLRLHVLLDRSLAPTLHALGLTRAEFDVLSALRLLEEHEGIRPKELAAQLLITTGGLSNVMRRLEHASLIERHLDPADKRSHRVRLTATGAILALEAVTAGAATLRASLGRVPRASLSSAIDELQPVLAKIDANPPRLMDLHEHPR